MDIEKENISSPCSMCPRNCRALRDMGHGGFCTPDTDINALSRLRIARAGLHMWEEPPISGKNGSGTVFFSGCNLSCVYCQNYELSHNYKGYDITEDQLISLMIGLEKKGAHNINLVSPDHYADIISRVLQKVKPRLSIPIVYNCNGYTLVKTLDKLFGLVDIFLVDFKYSSSELSKKYSHAPDYATFAEKAIVKMHSMVGDPVLSDDGLMKKGVIIRHLVLPGCRHDSIEVMRRIVNILSPESFRISLMNQFIPDFTDGDKYPELMRRTTKFEYESVLRAAEELGFDGYYQGASAASLGYTPEFFTSPPNADGIV